MINQLLNKLIKKSNKFEKEHLNQITSNITEQKISEHILLIHEVRVNSSY